MFVDAIMKKDSENPESKQVKNATMEILFLTHKHPPAVGGMERQSFELISGVSRAFRTHTLICNGNADLARLVFSLGSKIKRALQENPGISIVHLNDGLMAILALPFLREAKIPVVATIHGLDIVMPARWYQRGLVPRFNRLDGIIAVSRATAQECLARGFDKERIFVVPNGVDPGLAEIPREPDFQKTLEKRLGLSRTGRHLLVSVGRPVKRKGFSWFLNEVLPLLDRKIVYLILGPEDRSIAVKKALLDLLPQGLGLQAGLILGLPLDEPAIRTALKNPALQGRAFFLSDLPFQEMVQILKEADLFVMPNIKAPGDAEGFGLVALEAAVCGLPVVASGIEGIIDAVSEGENGCLLPPQDPHAWRERIHGLLADAPALRTFGARARDYTLANYSWRKMCEGYISVFTRLCASGPRELRRP